MFSRSSVTTTVLLLSGILGVTAPAQYLVRDINPGSANSSPGSLTEMGGTLFFRAIDAASGAELWRSDGTSAGTAMVIDINPGAASATPSNLLAVGGVLYFTASDGSRGTELWRTDGTAANTTIVADINPGSGSSSPSGLVAFGPFVFFSADDGTNGRELWRTDGSIAGTVMVTDINPGNAAANPAGLVFNGSTLFFSATDGTNGIELWQSQSPWNQATTSMVLDINPGTANSSPAELVAADARLGSLLFFRATNGTNGVELWRSDGTAAGTSMVADINPGAANSSPVNLTLFGSLLFFTANDGTSGVEPWKTDGTGAGTVMVADVNPGSASSAAGNLVTSGVALFFTANDGTHGQEVWQSLPPWDSTSTALVRDINPGTASGIPPSVSVAATRLLYSAAHNVRILFSGLDGVNGSEPWVTDGTSAGTVMIANLNPGSANAAPQGFLRIGGLVYFAANDGANGIELWAMPLGAFRGALAEPFGIGCPGTGGLIPASSASGLPVLGNATFAIQVTRARANSAALLMLDAPRSPIALPGGCTLYVPGLLAMFATATDGGGAGSLQLGIPSDTSLVGGRLFSQWVVVDPAGAFLGLASFSDGLQIVIGT